MKIIEGNDIPTPDLLIARLEELSHENYVFRGQPSTFFCLIPKAFRENGIRELSENFPIRAHAFERLIKKKFDPSNYFIPIEKLTIYIMQYNYSLAQYIEKNLDKFDNKTKEIQKKRGLSYWLAAQTLYDIYWQLFISLMTIYDIKNNIIKKPSSSGCEELTGFDETLPQHYAVPTAALDWTRNLYIAIYFALENIPENTTHISVYAYKEINSSENNPLVLMESNSDCRNERVKAQEGLFIRFRERIALFNYIIRYIYDRNDKWLSMEDCDYFFNIAKVDLIFDLIKFNVPVEHYDYLKKIINSKGKTKDALFPNL